MENKNDDTPQLRPHVFDGIQEYDQKLPNWWLFTFYIAIAWFVIHWLAYYQFKVLPTDEERINAAMASIDAARMKELEMLDDKKLWAMSRDPKVVEAGKATFLTTCAICHGADLMAKKSHPEILTLIGLPLADQEWKYGGNPSDTLKIVRKGSPDVTKGMPAWEPVLGVKRVVEVVAFVYSHHKEGEPITLSDDSPLKARTAAATGAPPASAPSASLPTK